MQARHYFYSTFLLCLVGLVQGATVHRKIQSGIKKNHPQTSRALCLAWQSLAWLIRNCPIGFSIALGPCYILWLFLVLSFSLALEETLYIVCVAWNIQQASVTLEVLKENWTHSVVVVLPHNLCTSHAWSGVAWHTATQLEESVRRLDLVTPSTKHLCYRLVTLSRITIPLSDPAHYRYPVT